MIPEFINKEELFKYLRQNKRLLTAEKKSVIKYADCVDYTPRLFSKETKDNAEKALTTEEISKSDKFTLFMKNFRY